MAEIVERIPQALQAVFGGISDEVASACRFVKRRRTVSGAGFVRAMVFGWLANSRASIEQLAEPLGISGSALQQRLTTEGYECLRGVLMRAVELLLASRPARIPVLAKFNSVYVEDCSTISLPSGLVDAFPGCGGNDEQSGQAALRLFTSYELKTGALRRLAFAAGRGSDAAIAQEHAHELPSGAMRLRDMGFFDRQLLAKDTAAGGYWISRIPVHLTVHCADQGEMSVTQFLSQQPVGTQQLDTSLSVGRAAGAVQPLSCRLVAIRCPVEVAARRRQKVLETARRKGRTASERQLAMCDWTVFITNVPQEMLSYVQIWELYRARWQIELLFKRWKSLGGVQVSTTHKPARALCELYAKLLGMLVAHWFTLIRGGPLEGFSLTKAIGQVQARALRLADALLAPDRLAALVTEIANLLARLPKQPRRKKRPSTRQRLFHQRHNA